MVEKTKNVGREMVERAGVDVELLIDKLKRAAAAEFTTYYYYTLLRMHCTGIEGESIKEVAASITPAENPSITSRTLSETFFTSKIGKAPAPVASPAANLQLRLKL